MWDTLLDAAVMMMFYMKYFCFLSIKILFALQKKNILRKIFNVLIKISVTSTSK